MTGFQPKGLDPGVELFVDLLRSCGIETIESCQGGPGHGTRETWVSFGGSRGEGYKAMAYALNCKLPVRRLSRQWMVDDGEILGPRWQITFSRQVNDDDKVRHFCSLRSAEERDKYKSIAQEQQKARLEGYGVQGTSLREPGEEFE